ncbi:MAG: glycoside hydrolase family 2, partial [Prevotella sp.]|nr:glycoside hydrolase family 2 [Prevotella sp.]
MRRTFLLAVLGLIALAVQALQAVETQRQYLSGHGCDDMVQWDFQCSDGRNSGKWTKIGVPSCWELQGFGTYQYGMRFYGKATPEGIADEKGLYKHEFTLPEEWQGRQILLVFEAAFTEIRVQINGRKAGNGTYQGGFTRHTMDVSDRVFFGKKKNRLEVEVLKESTVPQVNLAERRADYWNFGGIWRPVFVISKPAQNISRVAIDAKHDGRFMADVFLNRALPGCSVGVDIIDANGKKVAQSPACPISSDGAKVDFNAKGIKAWNAEQPNLYTAVFTLKNAEGKTLHIERQRFGFRTIEYRHSYPASAASRKETGNHVYGCKEDGLFINGQKVIVKGANRHSFRPETGRTLSKQKNIEDVLLIKSMNMNAVRLSHYPADPEFLDACDSLGLYVECEQPGWHWAHNTIIGSQIVEEM